MKVALTWILFCLLCSLRAMNSKQQVENRNRRGPLVSAEALSHIIKLLVTIILRLKSKGEPSPGPQGDYIPQTGSYQYPCKTDLNLKTYTRELDIDQKTGEACLKCNPKGGNHPHRHKACRLLKNYGWKVENILSDNKTCPPTTPYTVTAWGLSCDKEYFFAETFGSRCEAQSATGVVFNLS